MSRCSRWVGRVQEEDSSMALMAFGAIGSAFRAYMCILLHEGMVTYRASMLRIVTMATT